MNYFLSFIVSVAAALYILPVFFKLLGEKRILRRNYSGKTLVTSMCLAMLFTCLVGILPFVPAESKGDSAIFIAVVALTGFLGVYGRHARGYGDKRDQGSLVSCKCR